jgi:hypothetical protein
VATVSEYDKIKMLRKAFNWGIYEGVLRRYLREHGQIPRLPPQAGDQLYSELATALLNKNYQNFTGPVDMLLCIFNLLTVLGKKTRVYCRRIERIKSMFLGSYLVFPDPRLAFCKSGNGSCVVVVWSCACTFFRISPSAAPDLKMRAMISSSQPWRQQAAMAEKYYIYSSWVAEQ